MQIPRGRRDASPREPRPRRDARDGDGVRPPQGAGEPGDPGEPAVPPDPRPGAGHPDGEAPAGSRGGAGEDRAGVREETEREDDEDRGRADMGSVLQREEVGLRG